MKIYFTYPWIILTGYCNIKTSSRSICICNRIK